MAKVKMRIRDRVVGLQRVRADDLIPNPKNWRRHPKFQEDAMRGVLQEIGFADALLARETPDGLQLIDGHLRAGISPNTELPVLVLDLDDAEADKLLATLDPLAAMAQHDQQALLSLLESVQFESKAVNDLLEALANDERQPLPPLHEVADPEAEVDRAEELRQKWQTECGQIWEIPSLNAPGKVHRLMCGDCTESSALEALAQGNKSGLLLTDPPYAVDYVEKARDMNKRGYGHSRAKGSVAMSGDGIEAGQEEGLWHAAFSAAGAALLENAAWYVWHAPGRTMLALHRVFEELGLLYHQTIIWVKNNFVIGRCDYQWKHEPCYYGWKKGHRPPFYGEKNQTTVWVEARDENRANHPTQKPVAIFTPQMNNHLKPGESTFDPFCGSGTTIIAAEQTGRICYGMEIEPKYVAVALERMTKMGIEPRLV